MICYRKKYIKVINEITNVIRYFEDYEKNNKDYLLENCDDHFYSELIKNNIPKISYPCPNSNKYCEVFNTLIMGKGVRAKKPIEIYTKIGCYLGIIKHNSDKLPKDDWKYDFRYVFKSYFIDGSNCNSIMSLINHSSNPNIKAYFHLHDIKSNENESRVECHIVFISIKDIEIDEELFIDYGEEYWNAFYRIDKNQRLITDYFEKI